MSVASARYQAFPHQAVEAWSPELPAGRLERIYLHWSGGDYTTVYPAYHYCIAWDGTPIVVTTNDLRANMRDVYASNDPYAAHTYRRNSFSAGLSVMSMQHATPADFGAFPLRDEAIEAMCRVAGRLLAFYGLDAARICTHAEAAIEDGYYGAEGDDVRWDIARLEPSSLPLTEEEARTTGDRLRARCAEYR
jgi:hypothetical protein